MTNLFPHAKKTRLGYEVGQVDEFFARARAAYEQPEQYPDMTADLIRRTAFDVKRGGYSPPAVDAALDRLETAFVARLRENFVQRHGHEAWMAELGQRAQTLYPRLRRPRGQRFAAPPGLRGGYDRRQVDALLDRLTAFFDTGKPITADEVRNTAFTRRAKIKAYDERTVDAYLARAVDVLLGVA